ncbi:MAG: sigma 54-interacting transcriptional regulator [Nitrospira sp.]
MADWNRVWRYFIASLPLQALTIGFAATVFAAGLWLAAPATYSALDWTVYDSWLSRRAPIPVSDRLVLIVNDPASEAHGGTGTPDRAMLAQLISAAHDAGAVAVGLDHRLDHAGPTSGGGVAGDALLLEAIKTDGPVVTVYDADTPALSNGDLQGHVLALTDHDHVTRSVPPAIEADSRSIPSFADALYALVSTRPAPAGSPQPALVSLIGNGSLAGFSALPLSSVWDTVQRHDETALGAWFKDKLVVVLPSAATYRPWLLPTGQSVNGMTLQLHRLNSLLTDTHLCRLGTAGRIVVTLAWTSLIAWILLSIRGSRGLLLAAAALAGYAVTTAMLLSIWHLVLPVALPLTASLVVLTGTTAWTHLTAGQRMILLERDMLRLQQDSAAVREALVLRENRAEALQEDLESARELAARSTGIQQDLSQTTEALRAELAEVQAQEQTARRQLEQLERQLDDLRAATADQAALGDAELDRLREECRQLGIVTQDPALLRMFRDVKKGAKAPLTVLLLGEPGTGKELFARAVHRLSPRAGKTFIAVNMAAISPELFESELFGHTKGSFTGATADRRGYFELADHGTIFLDEIGDLRLDHQSKLLRVLQDKSFYRVGSTTPTTVDVRVVAATNRDLQRGVSEGWFREDLYFRLKGLVFRLPPLRERPGDIPLLAESGLVEIATQLGKPAPKLSNDAIRYLSGHEWPGNVRELRHAIERAIVLNDGSVLTKQAFALDATPLREDAQTMKPATQPDSAGDAAVLHCLRQQSFDMQATAKVLGWDRSTVTQRLKGLCFQALVETKGDQAKAAATIAGDPAQLRTVELKLADYYHHLLSVIEPFQTAPDALAECRRRFKNLPDRHFKAVETLVKQAYDHTRH